LKHIALTKFSGFSVIESTSHILIINIAHAVRGDHISGFPRISSARNIILRYRKII